MSKKAIVPIFYPINWRKIIISKTYLWENLTEPFEWIREFIHRGLYGWSRRDNVNLMTYLAKVIAESLEDFSKSDPGHPCLDDSCDFFSDEPKDCSNCNSQYHSELLEIQTGMHALLRWVDLDYQDTDGNYPSDFGPLLDRDRALYERAMDLLKKHFPNMWM